VVTVLDDSTLAQHVDVISPAHGGEAMRVEHNGPVCE
jgi:hypothetical protein